MRSTWSIGLVGCVALLVTQAGCLNWSYRQLELGQGPADYDRLLPLENTRQTPLGFCYVDANRQGRIDAFVVHVGDDRRVVAKWQATFYPGDWLRRAPSYRLRGVYDAARFGLAEAATCDLLRLELSQLAEVDVDDLQRDAHGWVAAGLRYAAESLQGCAIDAEPTPATRRRLIDVPTGGRGEIVRDDGGVVEVQYVVGPRF